jgi:hypothetical protein
VSEAISTIIGHDVWIGEGAMVFEGVNVGTGAIIAARAVVTKHVPSYAIVAGVPARVVGFRHPPELIEQLLASRWWELDVAELTRLPMNQPQAFVRCLQKAHPKYGSYSKLFITRRGCYFNRSFTRV